MTKFKVLKTLIVIFIYLSFLGSFAYGKKVIISTSELEEIFDDKDVIIIDARQSKSYNAAHIKNALRLWDKDFYRKEGIKGMITEPKELANIVSNHGISNDTKVIIYDDMRNKTAGRVFFILDYLGLKNCMVLDGGIKKWRREKRQVTTEIPSVSKKSFSLSNLNSSVICSKDYVFKNLKNKNVVIIDARTADEYNGKISKVVRKGHIPGAINIDFKEMTKKDGVLKRREEFVKIFEDRGITKDKEVILHCCSSQRAGIVYLVLKYILNYPKVIVYEGAFFEWASDPNMPFE